MLLGDELLDVIPDLGDVHQALTIVALRGWRARSAVGSPDGPRPSRRSNFEELAEGADLAYVQGDRADLDQRLVWGGDPVGYLAEGDSLGGAGSATRPSISPRRTGARPQAT